MNTRLVLVTVNRGAPTQVVIVAVYELLRFLLFVKWRALVIMPACMYDDDDSTSEADKPYIQFSCLRIFQCMPPHAVTKR